MAISIAKLKKGGQVRTAVVLRRWKLLSSIGREVVLDRKRLRFPNRGLGEVNFKTIVEGK
jgi:hypothetical protein